MSTPHQSFAVYGPFDGDFDPFDDDEDSGPLVTFGRRSRRRR
jgi:hypothetical protein